MASVPLPDPAHDPGIAGVAAMLADLTAQLKTLNDLAARRNAERATELSDSERRVAEQLQRPCILERDAQLVFGGFVIDCTLRAYGRWHNAFPGESGGRGERPISPPEPAHYSVDSVTISTGQGSIEVEIYNALNDDAIDEIACAAHEDNAQ